MSQVIGYIIAVMMFVVFCICILNTRPPRT